MKLFTFWSFAPTTYIEHLCLKSMLAAGHTIDLFTYDDHVDVPRGVTVRDAAEVMPRDRIIFHRRGGSPALFSDLFRYAGLKLGLGTWIDADVILLRNISDMGDYLFGWQDDRLINGAILNLPPDSALFTYIEKLAHARVPLPAHWATRKKLKQLARACIGLQRPLEELDWGAVGPRALTYYVQKNGLANLAQPVEVFYPIAWKEASIVFDPTVEVENRFTSRTRAAHLWNFVIRQRKPTPPPTGCFIARMCEKHGVVL